jgi:hypothetical protein
MTDAIKNWEAMKLLDAPSHRSISCEEICEFLTSVGEMMFTKEECESIVKNSIQRKASEEVIIQETELISDVSPIDILKRNCYFICKHRNNVKICDKFISS